MVSIIIPTYNNSVFIGETLNSIINQSSRNWECLIIDDDSTDDSKDIIKTIIKDDNRFQFFERPKEKIKGANSCRNIGIEKAKGHYLMFLDADDLLASYCVESRLGNVTKDYDLFIFPMKSFKKNIHDDMPITNQSLSNNYLSMFLSYQAPWPITSMFIRRDKLDIFFNENLQRFQDVDFSIKLLLELNSDVIEFSNLEPDCFYRKDEKALNKFSTLSFKKKIEFSFLTLIESIIPLLKEHKIFENEKRNLKEFYIVIFNRYFNYSFGLLNQNTIKINKVLINNGVIDFNEFFKFYILSIKMLKPLILSYYNLKKFLIKSK